MSEPAKTTRRALGIYTDGPEVALIGECAEVRIVKGVVTEARFFRYDLGLFEWRRYTGGTFRIGLPTGIEQ